MQASRQTLLWQISRDGLSGVSYVFGTMHVRDQRVFQRLDKVYAAIEACEAFAAEFNLDSANNIQGLQAFSMPDNQAIENLLSPKKYQKLRRMLRKSSNIELDYLKYSQPILISNLIEEGILSSNMPFALDQHLWQYAVQHDKMMLGIETLEEQIAILGRIPIQYQLQALLSTIRNISRHRQNLLRMAQWYEKGNIQQLYQTSRRGAHGLRKLLLYDRNERMAGQIEELIRDQTIFCAIGAAHLAGAKGILRFLKQKGLKVKPLQMK
ncbi:MAG: TraB/GumN family protein [Saprospiraceae bacterium]|nr:TraB/GumN family protein [Saprospiraceae bacterium]